MQSFSLPFHSHFLFCASISFDRLFVWFGCDRRLLIYYVHVDVFNLLCVCWENAQPNKLNSLHSSDFSCILVSTIKNDRLQSINVDMNYWKLHFGTSHATHTKSIFCLRHWYANSLLVHVPYVNKNWKSACLLYF